MHLFLTAVNLDSIPQISLGTAALLIFGAIASLAVLRGLIRIIWGTTVLCLAGLAGFFSWQHSHSLAQQWLKSEPTWFSIAVPLVTFILAFILLRALGRFVVNPADPDDEASEKNRRSPIRWAFTLLFSLVPTSFLWFGGATLLRHAGSVAEVESYAETLDKKPVSDRTAFLAKLKDNIESAVPSDWFAQIDPLTSDLRIKLAKLISSADTPPPKALPVLQEPAMKQLILGDPELRRWAREGRYTDILRDPRLDQLLENDNLREVLQDLDL